MSRTIVRPLWVIGIVWAVTCLLGAWLPTSLLLAVAILCFLGAIPVLCVAPWRRWHGVWLCLLTVAAASGTLLYWQVAKYQPTVDWNGKAASLCVEVQDREDQIELKVLSGDLPRGTRLWLWYEPLGMALEPGDAVTASFDISLTETDGLEKLWNRSGGVWLSAVPADPSGEDWQITEGEAHRTTLSSWRRELALKIQQTLSGDVGAVVSGICLGADERLSPDATADFRACGVSHLFAVSGLHLSVLTQALLWLLKRLRLARRVRGALCAGAVVGFAGLVGWTPSVVRAAVVCLLVVLGDCWRRQADARNSLGAALLLLLVFDPFAVYDVGLLLSFTATFGLLFVSPRLHRWLQKLPTPSVMRAVWERISGAVAVTLSATAVTLPVSIVYFGELSLVGVIANVVMTVPATVLLVIGWMAIPALLLGISFVYYPLLVLLGWLSKLLLAMAASIASWPFSTMAVTSPYRILGLVGGLCLIATGWWLLRGRGVRLSVVFCAMILVVSGTLYRYRLQDTVRFLVIPDQSDLAVCVVYQRWAVLIVSPTEINTLYATRTALQRAGITALDAVVLPEGDWSGTPYLSYVLGRYLKHATLYRADRGETCIVADVRCQAQEDWLWVQCGMVQTAFVPQATTASLPDSVDVAFCVGKPIATEPTTVTVVQQPLPLCALHSHSISAPQDDDLWIWIDGEGELYIK